MDKGEVYDINLFRLRCPMLFDFAAFHMFRCSYQLWDDYNLRWNPQDYENITMVRVPAKDIWTPDLGLWNAQWVVFSIEIAMIEHITSLTRHKGVSLRCFSTRGATISFQSAADRVQPFRPQTFHFQAGARFSTHSCQ